MQPKETLHTETHIDYYVSPRKFIRYIANQGRDFTYADKFQIQSMVTITQLDNGRCHIENKMRVEMLASVFVQRMIISEGQNGTTAAFKDMLGPIYEPTVMAAKAEYDKKEK